MVERKARVVSVSLSGEHGFSKHRVASITLLEGLGVEGDAHCGATVKHRSRVALDPDQPNLRQVHLIASELLDELRENGFDIAAGDLGENVLTRGVDLIDLPRGALLRFPSGAEVEVTGLRNPCAQIDAFRTGLLKEVVSKSEDGALVRRAGIMGVVMKGGAVRPGDAISLTLPPQPHQPLDRV